MANYNKVLLMGNLTRDIELKYTQGNQAVASFGIAVNRRFKAADGQMREEVTFVDCDAWGRTAETMQKYLAKGRPVFIEGRLRLDTWKDKNDGSNRSKLKVVVENFQFVDSKGGGAGGGAPSGYADDAGTGGGSVTRPMSRPAAGAAQPAADPGYEPIQEDDIPF
ncbi:MAG: single-stranded DNA-binding protein [Phycisphaerales bacterium]